MVTARRLAAIIVVLLAALVAGCGGNAKHAPPAKPLPRAVVPGHPCSPSNFYMQCAKPPGLTAPRPSAAPVVAYGIDFGWSCPDAKKLGAAFGASYLSSDGSKNWTRACVDRYHAQGIATVAVWETAANRALAGYTAGYQDALRARALAQALGEPSNRPIFFAVDFDASANPSAVVPYFQGADSVLGTSRVGAGYGGVATMRVLFGRGLVRYGWQTAAWSGGVWDPRAQIEQYAFGQSLDWNRAVARDYGQWPYSPPAPPVKPIPADFYGRCSRLDAIQFFKAHAGHGRVSSSQHQQAVRIRAWIARNHIGCTQPGWQLKPATRAVSKPYRKPPQRPHALA